MHASVTRRGFNRALAGMGLGALVNGCADRWDDRTSSSTSIVFEKDDMIHLVDGNGFNMKTIKTDVKASEPVISPNGEKIAFVGKIQESINSFHDRFNVYIVDRDGRNLNRVVGKEYLYEHGSDIAWSPDSRRIAFVSDADGKYSGLCVADSSATGFRRLSQDDECSVYNPSWSHDGRKIAYSVKIRSMDEEHARSIFAIYRDGSGRKLLAENYNLESRDLYFKHDPDGFSSKDFDFPEWSLDGEIAYFENGDMNDIYAVGVNERLEVDSNRLFFLENLYHYFPIGIHNLMNVWLSPAKFRSNPKISKKTGKLAYITMINESVLDKDAYHKSGRHAIGIMDLQTKEEIKIPTSEKIYDFYRDAYANRSFAWSPEGDRIAYLREGDLYIMDLKCDPRAVVKGNIYDVVLYPEESIRRVRDVGESRISWG